MADWWSDKETLCFLKIMSENNIMAMFDGKKHRNDVIFKKISGLMSEKGYNRSPTQIIIKWKNLKAAYRKQLLIRSQNGSSGGKLPKYFIQMEGILGRELQKLQLNGMDTSEQTDGIESADNCLKVMLIEDVSGLPAYNDQSCDANASATPLSPEEPIHESPGSDSDQPNIKTTTGTVRRKKVSTLEAAIKLQAKLQAEIQNRHRDEDQKWWEEQTQKQNEREDKLIQQQQSHMLQMVKMLTSAMSKSTPNFMPYMIAQPVLQQPLPNMPSPQDS